MTGRTKKDKLKRMWKELTATQFARKGQGWWKSQSFQSGG